MKEKEKLKEAIKDVYNTFPKGVWLNTNQLFDIINYEYKFTTGVSKPQISSMITKNSKFKKMKHNNEVYYQIRDWIV